jgi:hypothetical protein
MNAAAATPTLFGRLARTPLRDAVRGRLTARLDIDGLVTASGIPADLGAIVTDVTGRTRLWRLERVEVAEELIAHFADGLDAGSDSDKLADDFGDPEAAARLIRRAKKRNRPRAWHAMRWALLGMVGLVLVYIGIGVFFVVSKPRPTVDYRPQLNAVAAAVPEADRAWPVYRTALIALGDMPDFEGLSRKPLPGEPGWAIAEEYLAANAEALATARSAAAMPGLGYIVRNGIAEEDFALWPEEADIDRTGEDYWSDSLISILLPHLSELRNLARALALDTHRAAAADDGAMVVENIEAMLAMAVHVRETPIFINDLVAMSIQSLALDALGRILADRPEVLTDEQLLALAHGLAATDDAMGVRFSGERLSFYDIVQRIYSDDGNGNGHLTLEGFRAMESLAGGLDDVIAGSDTLSIVALPVINSIMLSRRDIVEEYDRVMNEIEIEAQQPLWKKSFSADVEIERWAADPLQRLRHLPLVILMPALSKATVNAELARQGRDGAVIAIALEMHRRRTGAWPESLEELVPSLLPSMPVDRFDGKPMRYVLLDTGPVVYSVGANLADDGGVAPLGRHKEARHWRPGTATAAVEGDWVLWPAPLEPLEKYGLPVD